VWGNPWESDSPPRHQKKLTNTSERSRKMLGFIKNLDDGLMDFFEIYSAKIQRLTGLDCFRQAIFVFLPIPFGFSCLFIMADVPSSGFSFLQRIGYQLLLPVMFIAFPFLECRRAEKEIASSQSCVRNPFYSEYRIFLVDMLVCFVIWVIAAIKLPNSSPYPYFSETTVIIVKMIVALKALAMVFFSYLISCTPLPPGKSRVREWLESIASKKTTEAAPG
jgi:hypothetical protein